MPIRRADLPRDRKRKIAFGALRFVLYGMMGVTAEVFFYGMARLGRMVPVVKDFFLFGWHVDPRLELDRVWHAPLVAGFGQSSAWMFPVYGVCALCFLELIYRKTHRWHVLVRALLYGLTINAWEVVTGWVLVWLSGYAIWYYDDAAAIFHMSSFFITPVWMVAGLLIETVYRELMDPEVRKSLEATLP
jgi:hypothetical protein